MVEVAPKVAPPTASMCLLRGVELIVVPPVASSKNLSEIRQDRATRDVDVMVVADKLDYADVFSALQMVEAELARTVNPNLMRLSEWRRKRTQATGFV